MKNGKLLLTRLFAVRHNYVRKGGLVGSARTRKKHKEKVESRPLRQREKGLNIRHHDVNPEWNYTIFPRSTSKQEIKDEK
ncbi:hypothetical protein [Candidatus Hakubella thermalkaliphila]|nr:hypothetical protein [Candidatus Hakubella thermalkaliphila]